MDFGNKHSSLFALTYRLKSFSLSYNLITYYYYSNIFVSLPLFMYRYSKKFAVYKFYIFFIFFSTLNDNETLSSENLKSCLRFMCKDVIMLEMLTFPMGISHHLKFGFPLNSQFKFHSNYYSYEIPNGNRNWTLEISIENWNNG